MVTSSCGGLYVGGALLAVVLLAAVAMDLGGIARAAQRFYSHMPGGRGSVEFYRILAAVLGVFGVGFLVVIGPQIGKFACR
jgi:hypothetical protein